MSAVREQTDARFSAVLGAARGGGLARSNSMLARPGREGVLDFLYARLPHLPESARFQSFGLRYVLIRRIVRSQQLTIYDFAATRREALAALDRVIPFKAYESSLYIVDTERDERVCAWVVDRNRSRDPSDAKHSFRGAPKSLLALFADA